MPDLPPLTTGGPTGSAMPLAWAHAEYIKLVRSISDGVVFDRLDVVVDRYQPQPGQPPRAPSVIEIWNFSRPVPSIPAGATLRITWPAPFRLRHSSDNWAMWQDIEATATAVNIYYVDLVTEAAEAGSSRVFTFFWTSNQTWKGVNYAVTLR